jgi:hypothetical protein
MIEGGNCAFIYISFWKKRARREGSSLDEVEADIGTKPCPGRTVYPGLYRRFNLFAESSEYEWILAFRASSAQL